MVLDDSLLFGSCSSGKRPNFQHLYICSSTFYAMLDLHAGFIQYKNSYMLYSTNVKYVFRCFLEVSLVRVSVFYQGVFLQILEM